MAKVACCDLVKHGLFVLLLEQFRFFDLQQSFGTRIDLMSQLDLARLIDGRSEIRQIMGLDSDAHSIHIQLE